MKSKFKAGDLVTLSAAGAKSQQNEEFVGGFGFIETIDEGELQSMSNSRSSVYPIKAKWWDKNMRVHNVNFKPYELKFYKKNT